MNAKLQTILLITFISNLSLTSIIPAIYSLAKSFKLNDFQASLLLSIYGLFQFLATPILGKLSDKLGHKYILLISLFGTFLANLLAFSSVYMVHFFNLNVAVFCLFLARSIDGITGGNNSVAQSVIIDITDKTERARAFGLFGATFGIGFILGPSLVASLQQLNLEAYGLKTTGISFLLPTLLAILGVLVIAIFLLETNPAIVEKRLKKELENQLVKESAGGQTPLSPAYGLIADTLPKEESFSLINTILTSARESLKSVFVGMLKPGVGPFFVINFFLG